MQVLTGLGLKSVRHGKERNICVVDTLHMPSPIHAKLAAATERTYKVLSAELFREWTINIFGILLQLFDCF